MVKSILGCILYPDMSTLFYEKASFNDNINNWDVSNVVNMYYMFKEHPPLIKLNSWDVSSVTNMQEMFSHATNFNGDISEWVLTSVETMRNMFWNAASFNSDITSWDVSNVTNLFYVCKCYYF